MNPDVSVVIPTYNSENYLAQALTSVLTQTYLNLEIIVVDDASTDSTLKIARTFKDQRLKIISNSQNRGVSYGRNCGIRHARGNWIALLDSDDWYAPERLEKLLPIAINNNADLVADDLFLINDGDRCPWGTLLQENGQVINSPTLIDAVQLVQSDRPAPLNSPRNWSWGYMKPLIRREFLIKNQLQYNEEIEVGEDFVFYLECLKNQAHFLFIDRPYYYYRIRTQSLSVRKPTEYLAESCEITQSFINQETGWYSNRQLIAALEQNLAVFNTRLAYYRAIEDFKAKKIFSVIKHIISSPLILGYFLDKLIDFLPDKIIFGQNIKNTEYFNFKIQGIYIIGKIYPAD